MVEFFSPEPENSTRLLRFIHDQHGFSTMLAKSFDRALVRSCQKLGWQGSVGGFLFRKRESGTHITFDNAEISAAIPTDVEPLWKINEDFFESRGEIAALASKEKLWTVRVDGEIVGCGVFNRFIEDSDAVDIGMMVAP